jgi:hypothetical protein
VSIGEELGRARKVATIVEAIDRTLLASNMAPFSGKVLRELVVRLEAMTPAEWANFFEKYIPGRKFKTPSPAALAQLLGVFRERLASIEAARAIDESQGAEPDETFE